MLSLKTADVAHSLAVWCQVLAIAERDPALQAEYRRWAEWLENSAVAVRIEIEYLCSLSGPDGLIPESDQVLLEAFSRFTMKAVRRTRPAAE